MKTGIAFLCCLVGVLAYFAATTPRVQDEINKGPRISPNVMHRIALPCPPKCDQQQLDAIVKASDELHAAAATRVVLTEQDQRMISNAQMRKIYNVHE